MKLPRPRFSLRTLAIFTLLCTSGFGLWWHWEPWPIVRRVGFPFEFSIHEVNYVSDGFEVVGWYHGSDSVKDVVIPWARFALDSSRGDYLAMVGEEDDTWQDTYKFIWSHASSVSPDGERQIVQGPDNMAIVDGEHGGKLADLRESPGPFGGGPLPAPAFSSDGREIAIAVHASVTIYRRRRPEWWWGVFYLWEFWLTAAFAGLFIWSVVRDRRALAKEAPR